MGSGSGEKFHALKGVSIEIPDGCIFGVIGRSGAGKSTLVRTINLLERPTSGRVLIDGVDMTTLPAAELREARKGIGMIFQSFNLLSSRTVAGNVAFPLQLAGWSRSAVGDRVRELLELVELTEKRNDYPAQLSGGQKQRVGIARAIAAGPKILLCDEATSALDPQTTRSILELLQEINLKFGLTIVLITHEMSVIREICREVVVLDGGCVVERGTAFEVFTRPGAPVTRELVSGFMAKDLPPQFADMQFFPKPASEDIAAGLNIVLRISFLGDTAASPVISGMIRKCGVDANILYGTIDHIQGVPYGMLVVELSGESSERSAALNYLRNFNLELEVIGYVRRNASVAV
ncbi:MAG: ATP-binding cassette domain-containing protein [Synergistaceae bacterium]|jgi:D-methionine transport system ATP-binding protein|nr:ATP-binding cassette domain-containing protein [Synergistaceae bacterium]